MSIIKVHSAYKKYTQNEEENVIFNDLNLSVPQGVIYCLIGSSGVGKTSLLLSFLGMIKLDAGFVEVFNEKVKFGKPSKFSHLIGFMPQDLCLVDEMTTREMLNYFGNLYEMSEIKIKNRIEVLKEILKLPNDDQKIQFCSGGQKKRISLAAAIIHEPVLLLLDEPTVGIDPFLRENIWQFIKYCVNETKMTVFLTSHYFSEAKHANMIGMMRNGRLLVESSPQNLLESLNETQIDEAILKLCKITPENVEEIFPKKDSSLISSDFDLSKNQRSKISCSRLKALINKEWISIRTSFFSFTVLLFVSFLLIVILSMLFGKTPADLKFAIVDENIVECEKFLSEFKSGDFKRISCDFIEELSANEFMNVEKFSSLNEAILKLKKGKLLAVVSVSPNFTEIIRNFTTTNDLSEISTLNFADVYFDHTNYNLAMMLKVNLQKTFTHFAEKLMISQNISVKWAKFHIMNFEKPIYGEMGKNVKLDFFPGFLLAMLFFISFVLSTMSVNLNITQGIWNRTLLAGATYFELILAQFTVQIITMVFEIIGCIITLVLLQDYENHGSYWLEVSIIVLFYISGIVFGIFISTTVVDMIVVSYFLVALILLFMYLSNIIWSIEGAHWMIKGFSYILPVTLPGMALKNMVVKGYFWHSSIYLGFSSIIIWILISLLLTFIQIRRKNEIQFKM